MLSLMKSHNINLDAASYEHIVAHHANFQNVAMCLQTLDEIYSKDLLPTLRTVNMIIDCSCRAGMPRLALDVARVFEANSPRRLDAYAWLSVLDCSAEHLLVIYSFSM
jgi:pentatricopeptide repeat protein